MARTSCPPSDRARARWDPTKPDAPVTRTVEGMARVCLPGQARPPGVGEADRGYGPGGKREEMPMRLLRGLAGSLLWIASGLLGLVSILLCVTIILLPLGIPLLGLARRLMASGVRLMLPRSVAHPVKESRKGLKDRGDALGDSASGAAAATLKGG